jgi:signal transduction histidine kinase/CheY-like chemotaxis protein
VTDRKIENAPAGADPANWAQLQTETDMSQVVRAARAALLHPVVLLAMAFTTPLYRDSSWLSLFVTASILSGLVLRTFLTWRRKSMYEQHPARWRLLFTLTIPMFSVPVGLLYVWAVQRYGVDQWTFTTVLIWTSSIGTAAVVTFIPNLLWAYLQLLPVFVPAILISFWMQQAKTVALGFGLSLLLVFLCAQLRWLHTAYWRHMSDRALESGRVKELEGARLAAEAANAAKTRFIANVSYEIRTPMHSVLGMTELLLNTAVTIEQREYLFALRRSASSLLEIVNDLLDLSKIEAEKIQLEPEVFDLRSAIEDVRMTLAPQSDAKRIQLETSVESEVPLAIEGDPLRLRQVLVNLGGNAIKFTDSGFARVRVYLQQSMGAHVRLCFSVENSGGGNPAEISPDDCGSGLGLSIASQLVKLMGGEIAVENRPGIGSVISFCCTFPVGEIAEPAAPQRAIRCVDTPLHILVAEDNAVNQLLVVRLLKTRGHSVEVAATGSEAVHAVCSREFDLVLMDNQMPELSGIEATIRLREMGYTLPIVALSASAMPEDRESFLAAGMTGCLSKPFRPEELYAEIERATSATAGVTAS